MTEPAPGGARWTSVLPLAALVMVVALGVGIPVGLASGSKQTAAPGRGPVRTGPATPGPTAPSEPVDLPPTPSEDTDLPPADLSSAQAELWDRMEKEAVDAQSCHGYPPGESLAGVVASVECDVADSAIDQPLVYYQFSSARTLDDYLLLRAEQVDRTGDCENGSEATGTWGTADGSEVGGIVCVDNAKNGSVYFKVIFSSSADQTAVVVQDESRDDVVTWWREHAEGQFRGVGRI